MRVVICGGGAIGASVACFLARRGVEVVVVERIAVACAASGKSGGFLALDWCDGTPLEALARRSFALHAALAEETDDDWGYRRLATYGAFAAARETRAQRRRPHSHAWLADTVMVGRRLGSPDTTAQVHPARFTQSMLQAAQRCGATLRIGAVDGLVRDAGGRLRGVRVDGETVEGDAAVVCMGPWSVLAAGWLKLPPVYGLKGHSLVFATGTRVPPEAFFFEYEEADGTMLGPEIFPRADGTTYVCAISSERSLPVDPAAVDPDAGAIERLEALCARLSPALAASPIVARQACYRPVTRDGLPLIGPVPDLEGCYVATGHSVWGILNAPATGEALAELIADGSARTVDLTPFDPARMRPLDAGRLRWERDGAVGS
jgi:glycine/D-amino acid oxidase-like deaminating enzyme